MRTKQPTAICFYFQVHQPFRLKKDYDFFKMGVDHDFIDHDINRTIMKKITQNCYLKTNELILNAIKKHGKKINIAFSISGTALDQFELYAPEVLESFQHLSATGQIEFLAETYHHSLASILSKDEFEEQVELHRKKIHLLFHQYPTTFRNTELIYDDHIAKKAEELGFSTILAEGAERVLGWRSSNFVYTPKNTALKLMLKNYFLSDEIAFRFCNRFWRNSPLTADDFFSMLIQHAKRGSNYIGLFMDYETFGEHHRQEDGIFKFLTELIDLIAWDNNFCLQTPKEISQTYPSYGELEISTTTSWADQERDLSAWLGNPMQNASTKLLYSLERDIKRLGDPQLLSDWRRLLTSDHAYYACTKHYGDGAVHNYFSPYHSPYDAFLVYANAINDVKIRLDRSLSCS